MLDVKIALMQFDETHPLRLVGRNLRILDPVAAGVLVKVPTGIDGLVDGIYAEAGSRLVALSGLGQAGSS